MSTTPIGRKLNYTESRYSKGDQFKQIADVLPMVHTKSKHPYEPTSPNVPDYEPHYQSPFYKHRFSSPTSQPFEDTTLKGETQTPSQPSQAFGYFRGHRISNNETYYYPRDHTKSTEKDENYFELNDDHSYTDEYGYQHVFKKSTPSSSSSSNVPYATPKPFTNEQELKNFQAYVNKHKFHLKEPSLVGSVVHYPNDNSMRSGRSGYTSSHKSKRSNSGTSSTIASTRSSKHSRTSKHKTSMHKYGSSVASSKWSKSMHSKYNPDFHPNLDPDYDPDYDPDEDGPPPIAGTPSNPYRMRPYKTRPKFEKAVWDGTSGSFREFSRSMEGHLLQVGGGYMLDKTFFKYYINVQNYIKTYHFWNTHHISIPQATYDISYFYGIQRSATKDKENKTLNRYHRSRGGVRSWFAFVEEY